MWCSTIVALLKKRSQKAVTRSSAMEQNVKYRTIKDVEIDALY